VYFFASFIRFDGRSITLIFVFLQFFPTSAPVNGNTVLEIKGKNFDRQLRMDIKVAGISCKLLSSDWYVKNIEISVSSKSR